ncbi:MAG: TraB/GumN family protein [Wenzhouxiangellaceae bacterium]|nr:TraB/GumN family protein [Wenzhouxiangellaceae bacterium]
MKSTRAARPACRFAAVVTAGLLWMVAAGPATAEVFYRVEAPDGGTSWLLGTLHSEDERVVDWPPAVDRALEEAGTLALELVPDPDLLARLNRAMTLPPDMALDDLVGDELYEDVLSALSEYGMDEAGVARLRPWAAALTLSRPPPETGMFMDFALAVRAGNRGMNLVALETLDEQLDFLTGLGPEAHIEMLEAAVSDMRGGRELFEELVEAYLEGDAERLRTLAERELAGMDPGLAERFRREGIVERNRRMAERAAPLLDRGGTLVAVGALHLPGPEGLVALLRERGFEVRPVF